MRQEKSRHHTLPSIARLVGHTSARLVRGFARDRSGAAAVFFALAVVPLVAFLGLAIDTTRGYLVKSHLNQALDAAALAGGRVYDEANRDADIQMYFKANFPDGYLDSVTSPLSITPDDATKTLTLSAVATVPTTFMRVLNIDTMAVSASTAVTVSSQNVEVALVLDITGSMGISGAIADLRAAANDLVDIVVQDQQVPYYSKVAIVPFSQAVNVGADAEKIRGAIAPGVQITNITKANPVVVTAPNHQFNTGDKIFIRGVAGFTGAAANNTLSTSATAIGTSSTAPNLWVVQKIDNDRFNLRRCSSTTNCSSTTGVSSSGWSGSYTLNTGFAFCTAPGCEYQAFQNTSNNWRTHQISTCVTDRSGAQAYTDAAPGAAPVGRNYPEPGNSNPCVSSQILPLTSNKATLHARINALQASGSTAGQIGTAWGWYMLSPNFGDLWPAAENKPAAYGTEKLVKVAVIMTDGDFNTVYYNGIIAQDSGSGSGSGTVHVNHNSSNGNAFAQAKALCAAMKAPGKNIEIYTVGLGLSGSAPAVDFLNSCATSLDHVYLPNNGTDLQTAFHDIAQKISKLRLSK